MDAYILYSSNTRPKYVSDILNVLSLPKSSEYYFRYKEKYITDSFKHYCSNSNNDCSRLNVLVAYRDSDVIIPVRWVSIVSVEKITDFYIIKFRLGNYIEFKNVELLNLTELKSLTANYLKEINNSEKEYAIQNNIPPFIKPNTKNDFINWINTCKVLSLSNTFNKSFFLNIEPIINDNKKKILLNTISKHFELKEQNFYSFKLTYYSKEYINNNSQLIISSNSESLKITSLKNFQLESRYDSFKTWFKCLDIQDVSLTEIQIKTVCDDVNIPHTSIRLPIKILNSHNNLIYKIITSFSGAFFLTLPTILPNDTQVTYKILSAIVGALIISISSVFKNPFK